MSVLPQLERELLAACAREAPVRGPRMRRPRFGRLRPGAVAAVAAAAVALVVAGGALVALRHRPAHDARPGIGSAPSGTAALGGGSAREGAIDSAYAAAGRLYVVREASGHRGTDESLERVDPATGRVLARLTATAARIDQMLLVDGRLWVTASSNSRGPVRTWLTIHDADSLARLQTVRLQDAGLTFFGMGSMARAGTAVWIGDADGIDRFSAATATLQRRVPIASAHGAEVATNPAGTVLVDDIGSEGPTRIERRDPATGALQARSGPLWATSKVFIGGIAGQNVWISAGSGMHGYFERLNLGTLRSERMPPLRHEVLNGIRAQVLDGIAFISEGFGGPALNFCADPATGVRRAGLPLPRGTALLTADARFLYYANGDVLARMLIPARCRG